MNRARSLLQALLAAGLSWLVLVGAIALAMVVPRLELLSGFGAGSRLDYSAYGGGFSPLSAGFIADILGLDNLVADERDPDRTTALAASGSTGFAPSRVSTAGPTDVEHPFTNDDVDTAYPITSLPFRGRTDTSSASRDPDEPSDCSPTGGTAWYRYRPTAKVALFADTFGTPRATALSVYSGRSPRSLRPIGCDRSVLGNAQVGFRARAGTTYWFQLTGMVRGGPTVFELVEVGPTTVETLSPSGAPADATAVQHPDISADGRWVVFHSYAQNLTRTPPKCGNEPYCTGLYLRDRVTGRTSLIASNGTSYPAGSGMDAFGYPSISADGRYVAFAAYSFTAQDGFESYQGTRDADRPAHNIYLYDRVTRRTRLVSRNSAGEPARRDPVKDGLGPSGGSFLPSVSATGRYVTFNSSAANLGAPVEPIELNVFRRDRVTGITRLVSTDSSGEPNRAHNCAGTGRNVSADGRYVIYMSTFGTPSDMGAHTTGGPTLVYLWDARTGRSRLISKVPEGTETLGNYCPAISADGSRAAFVSRDPLVPDDTNGTPDVYAYDIATGRLQRISVTSDGRQTHDPNFAGREHGLLRRSVNLSADGRYAVFDSAARDLAPSAVGSTRHPPETTRAFLHDIVTGATVLVSVSETGEPLPGDNYLPYISADGKSVVFMNAGPSGLVNVVVHELPSFR